MLLKKQVFTFLGVIFLLCLINYTSLVSAVPPVCKDITYRQIMNELDDYIRELDRLDHELSWTSQQEERGSSSSCKRGVAELNRQRERSARNLMRVYEQLDRAHVDIGQSLMGSPTGFCEENGHLYSAQAELPSRTVDSLAHANTSDAYIENGVLKRRKKAGIPTDSGAGKDDYNDIDAPSNGWREHKKHLGYTRSLLYKKDVLTMEQAKIAAKLGAVSVPELKKLNVVRGVDPYRRNRVHGHSGAQNRGASAAPVRRWIDRNGVLRTRRNSI